MSDHTASPKYFQFSRAVGRAGFLAMYLAALIKKEKRKREEKEERKKEKRRERGEEKRREGERRGEREEEKRREGTTRLSYPTLGSPRDLLEAM